MTFDITGLLIFLLGILPGFLAQQTRYSIFPRSLKPKSVIEETGYYIFNSILVHALLILLFSVYMLTWSPSASAEFSQSIAQHTPSEWIWKHWILTATYFGASLAGGFLFGLFRGWLALRQPIRNWLAKYQRFDRFLTWFGIWLFLQEDPVWFHVFRQQTDDETIFLQVKMKSGAGFYTGQLESYGILDDSEREKDFYLVRAHYKVSVQDKYQRLHGDGVLLNFGDVESIQVTKICAGQVAPSDTILV